MKKGERMSDEIKAKIFDNPEYIAKHHAGFTEEVRAWMGKLAAKRNRSPEYQAKCLKTRQANWIAQGGTINGPPPGSPRSNAGRPKSKFRRKCACQCGEYAAHWRTYLRGHRKLHQERLHLEANGWIVTRKEVVSNEGN